MVLSAMIASGRPSFSLRSKWTCRESPSSWRHGVHRWTRNQPESTVGGAVGPLVGDVVVPVERVAVLDRHAGRPDVAALHEELGHLLVLHFADQRLDLRR